MTISRDTFDALKRYRKIKFHQDRDLLDSELNELQSIIELKSKLFADIVLRDGAILDGLNAEVDNNVVNVSYGTFYIYGSVEEVLGANLTFDPAKDTGVDVIYAELLRETIGVNQDSSLINIYTGEPTAEREKLNVTLKSYDTTSDPLPAGALARHVIPLFLFDRATSEILRVIIERSDLRLRDFQGTLDGSRIALASITEDQLGFAAAEGLTSILQNLAERTFDQAGSYVVNGLDSFIGQVNGDHVEIHTNPGRAYIRGYRFQIDLPVVTSIPIASQTRHIDDELKFYKDDSDNPADQFYWLKNAPIKEITNLKANVQTSATLTKGASGGSDPLPETPAVDIIEIKQGGTTYQKGVDYTLNGNNVNWLGVNEPAQGTSYDATWIYTKELTGQKLTTLASDINATTTEIEVADPVYENGDILLISQEIIKVIDGGCSTTITVIRGVNESNAIPHNAGEKVMRYLPDFIVGGAFGQFIPEYIVEPGTFHYVVTTEDDSGQTNFVPSKVKTITTPFAGLNKLTWSEVTGATKYNFYRSSSGTNREDFELLESIEADRPCLYYDIGQKSHDDSPDNPPAANTSNGLSSPDFSLVAENTNCLFFIPNDMHEDYQIVENSPLIIDYDYYLGRRDILYATTKEIKIALGQPADNPQLPLAPDGTLPLAEIFLPANSSELELRNLGLTRVTMEQIHRMMQDIEDLKYNDALTQMNRDLEGRDGTPKKGIYSDDFSSDTQSDVNHPDWNARMDTVQRFVAPPRTETGHVLQPDIQDSNTRFHDNIVLLPGIETVLISQEDFSESRNIQLPTPDFSDTLLEVTPNIVRPGQQRIKIRASGLQRNADNIVARIAGQVVASNLVTDEFGILDATIDIPESGLSFGDRAIEITDSQHTVSAGIRVAAENEISRRETLTIDWPISNSDLLPPPPKINRKPALSQTQPRFHSQAVCNLAQTFLVNEDSMLSAVGLYFTEKDDDVPITIKITSVTNGMPTGEAMIFKTLVPDDVQIDGETKVTFPNPVLLKAGAIYAVVLSTSSDQYQLRTATTGQTGQNGLFSRQAYERGNLLLGSSNPQFVNSRRWNPEANTDLTMKVYGLTYNSSGILEFEKLTGVQLSSLALDTYSLLSENTNLLWEVSIDNGLSWQPVMPEMEESLSIVATTAIIRARLSSFDENITPIIAYNAVNLIGYKVAATGTYITRMMETADGIGSTKVYAQMNIPSGCTVTWYASNDNGENWVELSLENVRAINAVWTEYQLGGTFSQPTGRFIRFKSVMTSNGALYPKIHRLGATLS